MLGIGYHKERGDQDFGMLRFPSICGVYDSSCAKDLIGGAKDFLGALFWNRVSVKADALMSQFCK